jgi:drug/metabolite transporter (DMT)-like permease
MTATAIILLITSAFLHAGWNLLGKRQHPTAAGFLLATGVATLCLTPIVFIYHEALTYFTTQCWWLILATGVCQATYFAALAGAYKTGDMSIAYPLARSSPVIIVTVANVLLGRSDQISQQCLYGIMLVVLGGFLLPLRRFHDVRLKNYLNASCLLALLAACGTAGYSMLDDEALRLLRHAPNATLQVWQITLVYAFLKYWLKIFV